MTETPRSDRPQVFNPPPNWPVEPGFVPSDGWTPDPSWGPAPEGWTFWLPQDTFSEASEERATNTSEDSAASADNQSTLEPDEDPVGTGEVGETKAFAPSASSELAANPKQKKRRRGLVAAIAAIVVLLIAVVSLVQQQQRAAEELAAAKEGYETSVSTLNSSIGTAEDVLAESDGAVLDESSRDSLETEIEEAAAAVTEDVDLDSAEALSALTSRLDNTRSQLDNAVSEVEDSVTALDDLLEARADMSAALAKANEAIPAAEEVLAGSEGKVNDNGLRDSLAAAIEDVRTHVAADANELDLADLEALEEDLAQSNQKMETAAEKVTADQTEWQKAADEAAAAAAVLDPATYASISTRDWQLVERDPAAHTGKDYVIYGKVTQFDSNTGANLFRANTDGQKQSRSYNYDINTMVLGKTEVLANVVQGDLVKLYVSVVGPYSYETTMGAEITVPMVTANIVEVYGSD